MEKALCISLLFFFLAFTQCEEEKKQEDFDGVGIGLVDRPRSCKKTTAKGDLLRVTFNVSIGGGEAFETTYEKDPLEFILGDGEMIAGFNAGLQDMCVGEVRYLTIPPQYAYGSNGIGSLPARVNFYFYVKLLSFETPSKNDAAKPNAFKQIDTDKDSQLSQGEVREYLESNGAKDQPGDHGVKQMLRDIFREEDRNMNGYIDHNEFSGIKRDEL